MRIEWKKLIIAVAIPLTVGVLSALLTFGGYELFQQLRMPPLSPPRWLFPVAWTLLYTLMGIASYRIWVAPTTYEKRQRALMVYGVQLFFNFVWSIIFFNIKEYFFAFVWLVALWLLIYITWQEFKRIDKLAGWMLVPYLAWVGFAGYLNLGIYLLN